MNTFGFRIARVFKMKVYKECENEILYFSRKKIHSSVYFLIFIVIIRFKLVSVLGIQ